AWTNVKGATVVPKGKRRISGYTGEDAWELKTFNFDFPANDKVTTRLRDILESSVDEKYYLDEDKTAKLVAQLEEHVDEPTVFDVSQIGHEGKARMYQGVAPTITAREYKDPRMVGRIDVLGEIDINAHRTCREVYGHEGISPALTTMGGGHREPKIAEEQEPKIENPLKGKTDYGWHFEQGVHGVYGLARTVKANGGSGNIPKAIEEVRPVLTPDRMEKRQNGRRF